MSKHTSITDRIDYLRNILKSKSIDAILITSYDEYLNEYVDLERSYRTIVSGFLGTAGDVLVTIDKAFLFVDGRYHSQAEYQVDKSLYTIEKVGIDQDGSQVSETIPNRIVKVLQQQFKDEKKIVAFDPKQISVRTIQFYEKQIQDNSLNIDFSPVEENPLDKFLPEETVQKISNIRQVPLSISGKSSVEKIKRVQDQLKSNGIDAFLISKLDEIAYITNLRSNQMDYNSTFKACGFLTLNKLYLFVDENHLEVKKALGGNTSIQVLLTNQMNEVIVSYVQKQNKDIKILLDPVSTNYKTYLILKKLMDDRVTIIESSNNPIKIQKAVKNNVELAHIKDCLKITDNIIFDTIQDIKMRSQDDKPLSENDIKNFLVENYSRYGVNDLSFKPICSIGDNSAVVHYTDCSENKFLQEGDLVLIDTGGYFSGGYATDITRTFIAKGKPDEKHKQIYTIVLKASIRGLLSELPPNSDGGYLDLIVRSVIQEYGYNYIHGTGHGVGILVHESPPTISYGEGGKLLLQENMVFSIEPGIYIEGWGGVRFENIVTLKKHSDKDKAKAGWLEVDCLTFAPVDETLIDLSLLDDQEKYFLKTFAESFTRINL